MKRTALRLLFACAAAIFVLAPHRAQAQAVVGEAGPFAVPISGRSVERISAALKLDAEQKALAKSLYSGYRAGFKQAAQAGDAAIKASDEKLREEGEQNWQVVSKERRRITREFMDKAGKLERGFLDDLKAILRPEQSANFERAERTRRREIGLKFSFISGEGIDVFQILTDLKIDRDADPALKEELEQYEAEVDRAMLAKDKMLRGIFEQVEKFEGPDGDPALIEKTFREVFESGTRLRDAHRQFVRKIVPLLPADKQSAFDRAVKTSSFPRIYRESAADRALAAARDFADLSPEQKSELSSIAESHQREADAANARWSAAVEDKQAKLAGNFMAMLGGMGEEAADDPLKLAREARVALDDRTIGRVTQVLTPDQRERLPKVEQDTDWHGQEFLPDFDDFDEWDQWQKEDEAPSPK